MDKKRYVFPPFPEDTEFDSYPYDEPFNIASATDFTGLVPFIGHDIPNRDDPDRNNDEI